MWTRCRFCSLAVLLLIAVLWSGVAAAQSREQDYRYREFGRYVFWYCPEDADLINPLWNSMRGRIPQVEQQLRLALEDSVNFIITPTEREWDRKTEGVPLWANGVAFPNYRAAVLKSPRFGIKYGGPLPQTAIHEYVHLLLETGAPGVYIPRWLDEGLAQVLAGQVHYQDARLLSRAVTANRLHRLWQIDGLMSMNAQDARLGYAQSAIAVEWLRDRYGIAGVSNLVHELRAGRAFGEAFPAIFGMSIGQFESTILQHIRETYKGSLYADLDLWIGVLFVLLLIAAGIAVVRRRRRTLDQWDEETHASTVGSTGDLNVPYTVNYTLIRTRRHDSDDSNPEEPPHDRPLPGN